MTSIDEAEKLAPCPFCGSPLVHHAPGQKGHQVWVHPEGVDCIARTIGIHSTDLERIAAWNRRFASRQAVVKRLEWWEPLESNNQTIGARSLVGTYYIHIDGGRHQAWIARFPDAKMELWEGPERGSLEQAKQDAQSDYTQRINSALAAPALSASMADHRATRKPLWLHCKGSTMTRVRMTLDLSPRLNSELETLAAAKATSKADMLRFAIEFLRTANDAKSAGFMVGAWIDTPKGRLEREFIGL